MDEKLRELLRKRIEEICFEMDISYYVLSTMTNVPQSTLHNIVRGKTKSISVLTIFRICEGLGISVVDFFDTEEFEKLVL